MGRNKKNLSEKKLEGNAGKRGRGKAIHVDVPPERCPRELTTDLERKYWKRYSPILRQAGTLTMLNHSDLMNLCVYEARLDLINNMLRLENVSLLQEEKNYHGEVVGLKESPYSRLSREYARLVRQLKADLGIRTDKAGGAYQPKPKKSEAEKFLESFD